MKMQISLRLEKDLLDEVKRVAREERKALTAMLRELISIGLRHKRELKFESISMSINVFRYMIEESAKHEIIPPLDIVMNDVQMFFLWNYGERLENVNPVTLREGLKKAITQIFGVHDVYIETQNHRTVLTFSGHFPAHVTWAFKVIRALFERVLKSKVVGEEISGRKAILIVEKED